MPNIMLTFVRTGGSLLNLCLRCSEVSLTISGMRLKRIWRRSDRLQSTYRICSIRSSPVFLVNQVSPSSYPTFEMSSVLRGINKIDIEAPFLQGRAFVFASQFSSFLPQTLVTQYLNAAVSVLESPEVSVPVKISAVKTIKK